MRAPPVCVLLLVFIGQHRFKRSSMQIERKDIGRSPGMRRNRRKELFIDGSVAHHANGRGNVACWMGRQNHAHQRASGGERDIPAIEERPAGARFGVDSLLIWRKAQPVLHGRQVQQIVCLATYNDPQSTRSEQISQWGGIAIQTVQAHEDVRKWEGERRSIAGDHVSGTQEFRPVIPIAEVSKRAEPLMRMCLEHDGSRSDDFPSSTSQVPWRADPIKPAVSSWKLWRVGQRPLPGSLPGPIDIDDEPMLVLTIPDPAWWGSERRSRDQVFLKDNAERLDCWLVQSGQKTAERRAMWEVIPAKERHEGVRKRQKTCVKSLKCRFSREGVTDEDGEKIDDLIRSEPWTSKPNPFL